MSRYANHDAIGHVERIIERPLSPLGRILAYIIGASFGGIHNAISRGQVLKGTWDNGHYAETTIRGTDAATHDRDELTTVVYLAHRLRVRVALAPATRNVFRITVLPGLGKQASLSDHPTLADMIARKDRVFADWPERITAMPPAPPEEHDAAGNPVTTVVAP